MTYDEICREIVKTAKTWFSGNMSKVEAQYIIAELNKMKREIYERAKEAV